VLDQWRAAQIPGEVELSNRFLREFRQHGSSAQASRGSAYFTTEDLDALFEDYLELLSKYGHTASEALPRGRPMQLRRFYIPDEAAPQAGNSADDALG
jgi:hypothetical protein